MNPETKPKKVAPWLLIVLLIVVLAGGGFFGWYFYNKSKSITEPASTATITTTPKTDDTAVKVAHVTDPGVTWIAPVKMDDLGLIKTGDYISEVKGYYKIADLSAGGEIILAIASPDGPGLPLLYRFKKDADGNYVYLVKHSSESDINVFSKFITTKEDYNTTYQSLTPSDFLTLEDTTLKATSNEGLFSDLAILKPESIGDTEYGEVFQTPTTEGASEVGGIAFNLKLADSTYRGYIIKFDFMTDDEVAQITWKDGTKNTAKFTAEGYVNCGMIGNDNAILGNVSASRLTEAGTSTESKEKIYTVAQDDVVMTSAYENYKIGRTKDVLSLADFAAKKPVFIWKSGIGTYIIFTGREYAGLAECGKPVIYLYPETPTNVSVKVAADITKSDPEYGNGWEALAMPSGKLIVNGKEYDSLFWEGQGQEYPSVSEGTIVARGDVETTIKAQLSELGLNTKESADFLEFWMPKMPDKAYVRLTWFGTSLMDKLAPLAVSPQPDTIIRVFLDFEGMESQVSITPQKLTSVKRKGFTLVEWGGLLKEN